jgi:hypothetical protein
MRLSLYALMLLLFGNTLASAQTVTYTPSNQDIVNPDRGFYHPVAPASGNSFANLDLQGLINKRTTPFTPYQANYSVRTSLVFRYYLLDAFTGTDTISAAYLNDLQTDFNIARQAGVKMIIRFAYTISPNTSCGAAACPPYGDVPKSRVLAHIAQLKPYLQNNADVISVVQAGFIGVWGENYYTDHFGDPSPNGDGRILDSNWVKRNEVLSAVLDAVPADRMVQVRYPQLKQRYVYGIDAPVSSGPLTMGQAYQQTDIARIGFHNDCFLASPSDFGTYTDYGTSSSFPMDRINTLKSYFADDGQYTVVGGETCFDGYSPENDCSGDALTDLESLHYSFLNSDYNNAVNNDWQTDGCMDEIKRRLGYRFVMQDGTYPTDQAAGNTMDFVLHIENEGYAAPFNERSLRLILRNTGNGSIAQLPVSGTNVDSRYWRPGTTTTLNGQVEIPVDVPPGDYELLLHILDPSNNNAIADRPEYSIQMANDGTWEANTGYNKLLHTIEITAPVENCDDQNLQLDGNPTGVQEFITNGTINSPQQITAGADVSYSAGNAIILQPGFSVTNGGLFRGYIEGCVPMQTTSSKVVTSNRQDQSADHSVVEEFGLRVFPNPSDGHFEVRFDMSKADNAQLRVFDWTGKVVATPVANQMISAGAHRYRLQLANQPPGVYVLSLSVGEQIIVQKIVRTGQL